MSEKRSRMSAKALDLVRVLRMSHKDRTEVCEGDGATKRAIRIKDEISTGIYETESMLDGAIERMLQLDVLELDDLNRAA